MPQATDTDTVAVAGLGNYVITDSDTCSACRGVGSWVIVGAIAYRISNEHRDMPVTCDTARASVCACVSVLVCVCVHFYLAD